MKHLLIILFLFTSYLPSAYASDSLSLQNYLEKVKSYNQDIRKAEQTLLAANATLKKARTGFFPSFDAGGLYDYNFNPQVLSLGSVQTQLQSTNWSAGAEVSQVIFMGGKLLSAYNVAKIQQEIASLSKASSIDEIVYMAEVTYWNTVASQNILDAAKQYINVLDTLYKLVEARFSDGLISKTDLLKIKTNLQEAAYRESKAEQLLLNSYVLFNVLMGDSTIQQAILIDSLQTKNNIPLITFGEVLQQRPDYLSAEKSIDLQKQIGKTEQSDFLPQMYVGAAATYGTAAINLNNNVLWTPHVYAKLNIPIFEWGKGFQVKKRTEALVRYKELEKSAVADNIRKELTTAQNNLAESEKQTNIAFSNLQVAQESLELHTFSYKEGQVSILDVQSAQMAWLQAQIRLIDSYLSKQLSIAAYKKAISE